MMRNTKIRTYSELSFLKTFEERFDYLRLRGTVGESTFGHDRYLNQILYSTYYWKHEIRPLIIKRDKGCDLGVPGMEIGGIIIVHHINPITVEDILNGDKKVFDPEFLISVSDATHRAIHYGDRNLAPKVYVDRFPGDTKLW